MDQIQISTFAELQAFLQSEGLTLRQGARKKRWWAVLEKFSDRGVVVAAYQGWGDDMTGAIADAIRFMHEQRRVRPTQFTKG